MGPRINIYTDRERFGAAVTIAHLAQFSFTDAPDSDNLTVYEAAAIIDRDWRWETEIVEMENGLGTRARFKDGSELSVSAWLDCCDGEGYCPQCWDGRTRFDA